MVEVLVAGGGPAGAAAALVLARQGVRVLLADASPEPGGVARVVTLGPGVLAELRAIGVADEVAALVRPLAGLEVHRGRHRLVVEGLAGSGTAEAPEFAAVLRRAAARAGAQVHEGVRVGEPLLDGATVRGAVLTAGARRLRLPAAVTIAADGRSSMLVASLDLLHHSRPVRRRAVVARFAGVSGLTSRKEVHFLGRTWMALTPVAGGDVVVDLVGPSAHAGEDPRNAVWQAVAHDELLAARWARAELVGAVSVVEPLEVAAVRPGAPGLLLAGDAAEVVDPIGGNGVLLALRGGALAADVALALLARPELDGPFELARCRRAALGTAQRRTRVLGALASHPTGQMAWLAMARLVPAAGQMLLGGATGIAARCTVADRTPSPRPGGAQDLA